MQKQIHEYELNVAATLLHPSTVNIENRGEMMMYEPLIFDDICESSLMTCVGQHFVIDLYVVYHFTAITGEVSTQQLPIWFSFFAPEKTFFHLLHHPKTKKKTMFRTYKQKIPTLFVSTNRKQNMQIFLFDSNKTIHTPRKFHIVPEKWWLEDDHPSLFGFQPIFRGFCYFCCWKIKFPGCTKCLSANLSAGPTQIGFKRRGATAT